MQPDGTAVLRKELGFLFNIQSVAISVSGEALFCKDFSSLETKATKKCKKKQNSKDNCRKEKSAFLSQFPVPVSGYPLPALGGIEMNAAQKNAGFGTLHPCTTN